MVTGTIKEKVGIKDKVHRNCYIFLDFQERPALCKDISGKPRMDPQSYL
jgi:hypothetical protein